MSHEKAPFCILLNLNNNNIVRKDKQVKTVKYPDSFARKNKKRRRVKSSI